MGWSSWTFEVHNFKNEEEEEEKAAAAADNNNDEKEKEAVTPSSTNGCESVTKILTSYYCQFFDRGDAYVTSAKWICLYLQAHKKAIEMCWWYWCSEKLFAEAIPK